ncbi:S66 family peptidase [Kocuria palustris]|uniref:S66 family peptidase n=1 Tax=Kocuria palustris TaxID=71999 RepID=UPI0023010095|nr:S66 peptidase family protein [Kocuria palustris]
MAEWLDDGMTRLVHPPKARPGDAVAVLSPAFAAPGVAPAVHEQAMQRLTQATGLVPVEYPTTHRLGASAQDRAADLNAAFGDPAIRAVLATIGGDDQITVVPHLDPELALADPKPFLGYSDNTNLSSWLWAHGVASFYGGSTQVHLGPGPGLDAIHRASLRAALMTSERLEITDPGESEDYGVDWAEPCALTDNGLREPTEPWTWAGPARTVTGRSWGGCLEVIQQILMAGRFPADPGALTGGVLLLETSEEVLPATDFGRLLRALGERGVLAAVDAVLVARPPASNTELRPPADQRAAYRAEQRDVAIDIVRRYNPDAVICVGAPFGHTRPQWILPYGGQLTVDGADRKIYEDYR